jgi:putative spermidine/putrescine transport system substrate-binding protein
MIKNSRQRLALFILSGAVAVATTLGTPALAQDSLTIANYGGSYGEAMSKAIWKPTAEQLGITIKEDSLNSLADIRTQVGANAVQWDVGELAVDECAQGAREGLFEPLDYDVIKPRGYDKAALQPTYILDNTASYVVGWNKKALGDNGPQTWADFWNVEKFPGTRAMRDSPAQNLEAALIADGVALDKLYPLDVDRAFKKLEEIKPHISVWWSSGAQSAQLVKDGEVDMIGIWSNRMQAVIDDGAEAGYVYTGGLLIPDCFFIPKGSKKKDLAMKAIALAASPEIHANIAKYIPISPISTEAYEGGKIAADTIKILPASPENLAKQVWTDGNWWAENGAAVQERWTNFMQQ